MDMERAALNTRVDDPSAMDIFQLKTNKGAFPGLYINHAIYS
jgi:hypothetical protein